MERHSHLLVRKRKLHGFGHDCQPFGGSFTEACTQVCSGIFHYPRSSPFPSSWQCRHGSWWTGGADNASLPRGLNERRPRVMGRPCGEAHRPIPKRSPHKGQSSASRSSGARWSRLKLGAFCAPAAPPSHPGAPPLSRPRPRGGIWSAPGTRPSGSRCAPNSGRILRPSRRPSHREWSGVEAALGSRRAPGSSGHDPGRPREAGGGDRPRSRLLQPLPPPLLSPSSPSLPRLAREAAGWAFHL